MKYQQVSVDLMNMMMTACSYLALAGAAWVFLRLLQACFWLPRHLRKQNSVEKLLQDKIDNYEKYLAECEAKDKLESVKDTDSDGAYDKSDKWQKQRESLELLKKELNRARDGVNVSDWDYLLEEKQDLAIGSEELNGGGTKDGSENDLSKERVVPRKEESILPETKDKDTEKDESEYTFEKKDN